MTREQAYVRARVAVFLDGCWHWLLWLSPGGYGLAQLDGHREGAHCFAYRAFRGSIPEGKQLDHVVCDQPSCCNPWHVEPRTAAENVLRSTTSPSAINSRKTHCADGHLLAGDNLYVWWRRGRQVRECRTCHRRNQRNYLARKEALWQP